MRPVIWILCIVCVGLLSGRPLAQPAPETRIVVYDLSAEEGLEAVAGQVTEATLVGYGSSGRFRFNPTVGGRFPGL